MKVLAIFTCYNRRELTRQSMELLGQNKNVTFDYVIVNDGSRDDTEEICLKNHYQVLNLPLNLGIGGAVQTGYCRI